MLTIFGNNLPEIPERFILRVSMHGVIRRLWVSRDLGQNELFLLAKKMIKKRKERRKEKTRSALGRWPSVRSVARSVRTNLSQVVIRSSSPVDGLVDSLAYSYVQYLGLSWSTDRLVPLHEETTVRLHALFTYKSKVRLYYSAL